ncbi:hypothetical protein [Reichenbachiella ulvae]|uniref:Transglutaminase-like superfamily protein n=1 Tax=Reichenbachiella ulvae TaxID=2980104 RepID=A0ABT3CZX9_9BACT|nr:hypothetical protein [Reichenbachiella ulvae]MCV9389131.1 hypothetical protein [Reichenbachiella ulvae]
MIFLKRHIAFTILFTMVMGLVMAAGPGELSKLELFVRDDFEKVSSEELLAFELRYDEMLQKLQVKKEAFRSDEGFLAYMYYKVHRKFLKQYEQQVLFSEILKPEGKYDCVTASALYALFLDDLGYAYDVVETDYHVYLLVKAGDREFLMETTDPLNGFSADEKEINERVAIVREDAKRINEELAMAGVASDFSTTVSTGRVTVIENRVGLKELAGLHYYNQSLKAFNAENYRKAYKYIIVAQGIYPSKRIKNASSFIFAAAFSN